VRVGIVGWGAYLPRFRIATREIARVWGDDALRIKDLYLIDEKTVEYFDEDALTMAIEASFNALKRAEIHPQSIDVVYVGTESKPYAVKPIASSIIDALGIDRKTYAVDMEFACKACSEGMVSILGMVKAGMVRYGLAVGTDTSQGEPGEHLEYSASSGAVAFIIGSDGVVAEIEAYYPYTSDTPDFWRRDKSPYPVHGEGFTGEPAYFRHIISAAKGLMESTGLKVSDFDYAVFHQPNTRFPLRVASILGFPLEKVKSGIVVDKIGNTYNASALLGLCKVLEETKPNSRILVVTYGSGAGSIAFSIWVNDEISRKVNLAKTIKEYLENYRYIDYGLYVKFRKIITLLH